MPLAVRHVDGAPGPKHGAREEIESILQGVFDEASKTSAIGKIEAVVINAQALLTTSVRRDLNPDVDGSSMARVVGVVERLVKEQVEVVRSEVREIGLSMAADRGRAEIRSLTSGKGFTFEDAVHRGWP